MPLSLCRRADFAHLLLVVVETEEHGLTSVGEVGTVTDERIGGAWILLSGCVVMSNLIMSSLGRTHAVKHDTQIVNTNSAGLN